MGELKIIHWEHYKKAALTLSILTDENYKDIVDTIRAEFDELYDAVMPEPSCPSMRPISRTCRVDNTKCDSDQAYKCDIKEYEEYE